MCYQNTLLSEPKSKNAWNRHDSARNSESQQNAGCFCDAIISQWNPKRGALLLQSSCNKSLQTCANKIVGRGSPKRKSSLG